MGRNQRFHDTGSGSFFGDMAYYERVLGRLRHHFLVMLNELMDWKRIGEGCCRCIRDRPGGDAHPTSRRCC